ncbi:DUF3160 domain-containing protein [Bacteroidota bacterium]
MKTLLLYLVTFLCASILNAQFDVEAYKEYLESHQDMTFDELIQEFPAGYFLDEAPTNLYDAEYGDSIDIKYKLTEYEKELISKHGFMVSERLTYNSFHNAFMDIYHKDMPVYISADAILFAVHHSFDKILKDMETSRFFWILEDAIDTARLDVSYLSVKTADTMYQYAIKELDFYLNMAMNLLDPYFYRYDSVMSKPIFVNNETRILETKELILNEEFINEFKIFSKTPRPVDFSIFKPRGHYAGYPGNSEYFRTMMWLGRMEIYITSPGHQAHFPEQTEDDLKRQCILSALLAEVFEKSGAIPRLKQIEDIIQLLIGRQDNITIFEAIEVLKQLGDKDAVWVSQGENWKIYQGELLKLNSANQLYNSQILASSPYNPEQAVMPTSMMVFGQRGIIDGYIGSNLAYDRIIFSNEKIDRPLPSTLDILYTLGNDASLQLLESEIIKNKYATNLAGLRYLISTYDSTFWNMSYYTNWLNAIRYLNPPLNRDNLPKFMQTAAWWQKSLNTQLASWSQLRHDFILYAKQPTSYYDICSFPYGYVEPVPELYKQLSNLFSFLYESGYFEKTMYNYKDFYAYWSEVCNNLYSISIKEIEGEPLEDTEVSFLKSTISLPLPNCVPYLNGWYPKLFYNYNIEMDLRDTSINVPCDYVVADIHTAPTYQQTEVGMVLHAGTGKVNMAVLAVDAPDGKKRAYIGPVMSYYETTTMNYKRLTDEEWEEYHASENSHRPAFTNLYMADKDGGEKFNKVSLYTLATDVKDEEKISKLYLNNYPNPFKDHTYIDFTVPPDYSHKNIQLNIYDIEGNLINSLMNKSLPAGNYSIKWEGTDFSGNKVNAGVYVYSIKIGEMQETGKTVLIEN